MTVPGYVPDEDGDRSECTECDGVGWPSSEVAAPVLHDEAAVVYMAGPVARPAPLSRRIARIDFDDPPRKVGPVEVKLSRRFALLEYETPPARKRFRLLDLD